MDIINEEYPPGVFLRGLKFLDKKIRGRKFLGENLSLTKIFQNLHFLEDIDPNLAKIVTISDRKK